MKKFSCNISFYVAQQQGRLIIEDSRSHSYTQQSVGLLWTSDQPDPETPTWQQTTLVKREISMPTAGFVPTIPENERLQIHALDRAATGVGCNIFWY
jgi:hypothetical protein